MYTCIYISVFKLAIRQVTISLLFSHFGDYLECSGHPFDDQFTWVCACAKQHVCTITVYIIF